MDSEGEGDASTVKSFSSNINSHRESGEEGESDAAEINPQSTLNSSHHEASAWSDSHQESSKRAKDIILTFRESQFLAAVLQDSVCQMLILNNCNREVLEDMVKRANDKKWNPHGDELPPPDRMESVDLLELSSDSHKLAKMENDRKYIIQTVIATYLDLKINGSFPTLLIQLSDLAAKAYQSLARELQYNEYRSKLKNLQIKIRKDTATHKSILNKCEIEIYRLLDEIDDSTWNSDVKTRYIEGWQNAQVEQHSLAIDQTEGVLIGSVTGTKLRIEQEDRINKEIEAFIKYTTEDYSNQIEQWMANYDGELEQLDLDLRVMKERRDIQQEAADALEKLKMDHKDEMDAWVAFITERARLLALEELRLKSTIKIQSWWKMILSRRAYLKMLKKARKKAKAAAKAAKKAF